MLDGGRISVLLVCDRLLILEGLRILVDSAGDLAVVGRARSGEEAVRIAARQDADVILVDLDLAAVDPLVLIRRLVTAAPRARVIGLTASESHDHHWAAALAGARGVIPRRRSPEVLLEAIREVHAGELWFDRQVLGAAPTRNERASGLRVSMH